MNKINSILTLIVLFLIVSTQAVVLADEAGFKGEYFNNPDLLGTPTLVRTDPAINFDWGQGAPAETINADLFSVRWTGSDNFSQGTYKFSVTSDDGVRLYLDDQLILDDWNDSGGVTEFDKSMSLGTHTIKMEFYERYGAAVPKLVYQIVPGAVLVATATTTLSPSPSPSPAVAGNVGIGVTSTTPNELPKTGLPFLFWTAIGLLPIGIRLTSFSKVKGDLEDSPNSIWEKRKFNSRSA